MMFTMTNEQLEKALRDLHAIRVHTRNISQIVSIGLVVLLIAVVVLFLG